jgi:hypothetical protein
MSTDGRVLKVMVSSTTKDLPQHREAARDAINSLQCVPLMMEFDTARSDSNAIKFSKEMVDGCDVYVGIFGLRRGFVPDEGNPEGRSITEIEYYHAKATGKQTLTFLSSKKPQFGEDEIDDDRTAIMAFRENSSATRSSRSSTIRST